MKKILLTLLVAGLACGAYAQPGGMQRRTVEERVQIVHTKIDSAFKPEAAKLAEVDAAFTKYYKAQDKMREDMTAGGERPDRDVMRQKMEGMMADRDKELQGILTADQFKTWKEQIEPSMRPQRREGGPGRN